MAITKSRKKELEEATQEWLPFTKQLNQMTEEETEYLLEQELNGKKRESIVLRLYGRFNRTRRIRELRELRARLNGAA